MRRIADIQIFLADADIEDTLLVGKIACHDDVALAFLIDDDGSVRVFSSEIGDQLVTLADELAEVTDGIILSGVTRLTCLAIYLDQCILRPTPGADAIVLEEEIPDIVFIDTVAQIIADEEEGMFTGLPVHLSVAALTF